jgi:ribokinase
MSNTPICVVGSLNMDLVAHTATLPLPGQTVLGTGFGTYPGGKGANQAVAAARCGAQVALVGCIGDDGFGAILRDGLQAEGIDLTHLHTRNNTRSGVAQIAVDQSGENTIIVVPGANATLGVAEIEQAAPAIRAARVLVLQLEVPMASVRAAAQIAHTSGTLVVLNPAPAQLLNAELLALCDVVVPNATEAALLSGIPVGNQADAARAGAAVLAQGASAVIVTLGSRGALLVHAEGTQAIPALPVQAVDTTAAGDAYVGALAVALGSGQSLPTAAAWAAAAGALATTRQGAQPSLPHRAAIAALLQQQAQ